MASGHTAAELRRFQGGGEARMVFAVDIHANNRVVAFPEETPPDEVQAYRDYTANSLRCIVPDCRAPLEAVYRNSRRDGFRHRSGTGNHRPVSLWHEQGKHLVARWAANQHRAFKVEVERASSDRTRRPDITVEGKAGAVAIEIQYSSISVDHWRQRHADLSREYLAQTWLLGHHGEHFKLTRDGRLRFSELIRAMTEVGCIPLWLNPETAQVLTASSPPDDYGPTPPHSDAADQYVVESLHECTLTPDGIRTPMLDALADAAGRRKRAAHQRQVDALRAAELRRQHWHESEVQAWALARHDGHLPEFITQPLRGEALLAEKLDLTVEHWKALVYHQIVTAEPDDLVTYKAVLAGLARHEHRGYETADYRTIDAYLRRLQGAGEVTLLTEGRLRILAARPVQPARRAAPDAGEGEEFIARREHQGPAVSSDAEQPQVAKMTESEHLPVRERRDDADRSGALQSAMLAEAVEVTRRSRWRLRRPWPKWRR